MRTPKLLLVAAIAVFSASFLTSTLLGLSPTSAQSSLNIEEVFRCHSDDEAAVQLCDEARGLILNNCTACHTFVPIVMQQFDEQGWNGLLDRHRSRVSHLSDEQVNTIQTYLINNFNPDTPPPELPPELLMNWTSY